MLGVSLVDRLDATSQAIREQQQVANRLVVTLAELVMETEHMAAEIKDSGLALPVLKQGPYQGPSPVDMVRLDSKPPAVAPTTVPPHWNCEQDSVTDSSGEFADRADFLVVPTKVPRQSTEHRDASRQPERIKSLADVREAGRAKTPRLFTDPDELHAQIRENLTQEIYDVTKLFKETGFFQAIVRKPWFETASMILVIFSCLWMAVEIDFNDSITLHESHTIFQVVAHATCLLFLLEILVRILAFRRLWDAMKDRWIVFDSVLVMLFVLETWVFGTITAFTAAPRSGGGMKLVMMLRVLRLLRIMRLARVFRVLPEELMVIIRGLGRALRAIVVVLILIGIIIFVAAILFTVLLEDTPLGQEYFSSVATSMGTLMIDFTLSGSRGTGFMRAAWALHPVFGMLMLLFVLLANITMLGVLTGLLVQTVKSVAEVEKEETTVQQLVSTMGLLWEDMISCGRDDSGKVERAKFNELISSKEIARVLQTLDIDVEGLASVSDFVFEQNHGFLNRKAFLQMVLDVRNNKKATVKDHIETRKFMEAKLLRIYRAVGNSGSGQGC